MYKGRLVINGGISQMGAINPSVRAEHSDTIHYQKRKHTSLIFIARGETKNDVLMKVRRAIVDLKMTAHPAATEEYRTKVETLPFEILKQLGEKPFTHRLSYDSFDDICASCNWKLEPDPESAAIQL